MKSLDFIKLFNLISITTLPLVHTPLRFTQEAVEGENLVRPLAPDFAEEIPGKGPADIIYHRCWFCSTEFLFLY